MADKTPENKDKKEEKEQPSTSPRRFKTAVPLDRVRKVRSW